MRYNRPGPVGASPEPALLVRSSRCRQRESSQSAVFSKASPSAWGSTFLSSLLQLDGETPHFWVFDLLTMLTSANKDVVGERNPAENRLSDLKWHEPKLMRTILKDYKALSVHRAINREPLPPVVSGRPGGLPAGPPHRVVVSKTQAPLWGGCRHAQLPSQRQPGAVWGGRPKSNEGAWRARRGCA